MKELTRRDFARWTTGASAAALIYSTSGCETIWEAIANRPVRRDLASLSNNHSVIQTYRAGVQAMRGLPASDERSWLAQAKIHDDHCPHGTWDFLPWHRAYLWYFQRIICDLTGNDDFGLPYWNWAQNPQLPSQMLGNASNPLFHAGRWMGPGDAIDTNVTNPTAINTILNLPSFFTFGGAASGSGQLESQPHNTIHCDVGGDMCSVERAALDPVFWTHHCNVDCLWVEWNLRGGENLTDPAWRDKKFSNQFVNESGNFVDVSTLSTLLMPYLSYRYDGAKNVSGISRSRLREALKARSDAKFVLVQRQRQSDLGAFSVGAAKSARIEATLGIALERVVDENSLGEPQAEDAIASITDRRLVFILDEVTPPENGEDFYIRAFLNRPNATAQTPTTDPHYVSSISFFMGGHDGDHTTRAFLIDATEVARRLVSSGAISAEAPLELTLLPVPRRLREGVTKRETPFRIGRLETGVLIAD